MKDLLKILRNQGRQKFVPGHMAKLKSQRLSITGHLNRSVMGFSAPRFLAQLKITNVFAANTNA